MFSLCIELRDKDNAPHLRAQHPRVGPGVEQVDEEDRGLVRGVNKISRSYHNILRGQGLFLVESAYYSALTLYNAKKAFKYYESFE